MFVSSIALPKTAGNALDRTRHCTWLTKKTRKLKWSSREDLRRNHERVARIVSCADSSRPEAKQKLNLTPSLEALVQTFKMTQDPKSRVQQLLFYAEKLPRMPSEYAVPENKVQGCLSTVYVHAMMRSDGTVEFVGDSDAQLTKGLVALLVKGLSGSKPEDIIAVSPEFMREAGLNVSLTPGRTNGFLNMLRTMKEKTARLLNAKENGNGAQQKANRPMYNTIREKLQKLQPRSLTVRDDSDKHIGHEGARGLKGESHFTVHIVSEVFEGLSHVKRHQVIYALLNDELTSRKIHALSIHATTPQEMEHSS